MQQSNRITLIAREATKPDIDWNYASCTRMRVAFVGSVAALRYALESAVCDIGLDVGRVVVDRAGCSDTFLALLTSLPGEFTGDVFYIRDDGTGILSATARGGDRVLYALTPRDVRFYLETNDLVTGRSALKVSA
jgi:hypothetical protein